MPRITNDNISEIRRAIDFVLECERTNRDGYHFDIIFDADINRLRVVPYSDENGRIETFSYEVTAPFADRLQRDIEQYYARRLRAFVYGEDRAVEHGENHCRNCEHRLTPPWEEPCVCCEHRDDGGEHRV